VADVFLVLMLGVPAHFCDMRALPRVVQVGERRVIDLQVGATELAQAVHLVAVGRLEVAPEATDVGIYRLIDGRPVMQHVGRWDRQLRHLSIRADRSEVAEVLTEDGLWQAKPAVHAQRRSLELDATLGVLESHGRGLVGHRGHPVES